MNCSNVGGENRIYLEKAAALTSQLIDETARLEARPMWVPVVVAMTMMGGAALVVALLDSVGR